MKKARPFCDSRKDSCDGCQKPLKPRDLFFGYRMCEKCLARPVPSETLNFKHAALEYERTAEERAFFAAESAKVRTQMKQAAVR